jgi:hypothetical protein
MNELATKYDEVVLPWDIDRRAEKWLWPVNYIATRSIYDRSVWREPDDARLEDQVTKMLAFLQGTRNFVLCFCNSPIYMRSLYQYIAAAWALTTFTRSEIADIQTILSAAFEADSPKWEAIEEADLLILPYADSSHIGLKKVRGHVSNMLLRRRALNKPTITDLWVADKPPIKGGTIHRSWYLKYAPGIKDLFGELAFDMFYGDRAKHVYVSTAKKG